MKKSKFKNASHLIRLWLFQVVLLSSVFAFSGINLQIQGPLKEPIKTELVESVHPKPVASLKKISKEYHEIGTVRSEPFVSSFCVWSLLNHQVFLKSKLKSFQNSLLLYPISSIELPFKIPSSTDKIPHLPVS